MFPEPTELLLIGCLIESIWTPRSKSNTFADILTKGNLTRDEWNHLVCLFNINHFSSINNLEVMSKRTQEDAGEERVTAKSKPMMNLVPRYRVRDPNVLVSTASESPGKTKSESQNVLLSSLNVQQTCTVRPVLGASSSNYSEWNIDDKWSSQVWKSGEMSGTNTERPVYDKFVIDDMDCDTATESNFSLKSRSFLHRVSDRLRKMLDNSQKMHCKTSTNVLWFEECLCLRHWKHLYFWERITKTICIPSKIKGKISLKNGCSRYLKSWYWNNRMRFLECLISAGRVLHGSSYLWSTMKKSSVSRIRRFMYSQVLCYVLERWIRTQHQILFGKNSWVGSKIHHNTEFWTQLFAERFPAGRWSFFGLGSEKKWYSTCNERPQGEWDRVTELMMIKYGESGHPVFRATSPLSRGTLKSKGGGKLSFHFCADGGTMETVFRTIISVNQLSIYGAVSDVCEEYSACQTSTGRPVLAEQSDPLFAPANLLIMTPRPSIEILAQEIYCKSRKNEWKGSHNKIVWFNFVLMQDSWKQLKSDSTSWQSTLTSSYNLQSQWHVVSTLYLEMKKSTDPKDWIRVNTKFGPVLEVTTSYLQGKKSGN